MSKVSDFLNYLIDKVLTWQFIALLLIALFFSPIEKLLDNTGNMKIGDFQLTIKELSESKGLDNLTKDLQGLSYEELKIFLIVCGEDATYYRFAPTNLNSNVQKNIYGKLQSLDLIEYTIQIEGDTQAIHFGTTEKGEKAHRVIIDALYTDLVRSGH
ncbi:hypothetical protein [Owenweeksia hongkongensis]|uniref:Uncharacterized protein n=1 Tax=Owenweeksia hongkongensis (strain DSM 17368 / CIP 108786 / JCM 12287 / NRRL B-23963 / UST20020801) TaxID=926562 RepID=G8R7E6_OWEHD|nr:hypothetical protein [Owenweeksia hongkongensis]AEV31257.1 hypothetical protein Oweho_0235 [Owenweeksia hongkongensis DSM 17368]